MATTLRPAPPSSPGAGRRFPAADFTVQKALTIRSQRTKYKLWLANATMIDFSADRAWGSTATMPEHSKHVVHSFEFGVGHPGLAATGAGGAGTASVDPALLATEDKYGPTHALAETKRSKNAALVHRPYHVPDDLGYEPLFQKGDYQQYKKLRDDVLGKVLELDRKKLEAGGNKASVLARRMGLITGS